MSIDWTNQNVMPYIQELISRFITYRTVTGIFQIVIWTGIIILGVILLRKLMKWKKSESYNEYGDDEFLLFLGVACLSILIITSICFVIGNIFGITQNIFMPEMTVYEYISNFM